MESQKKRNDSFLTIKRSNMDGFSKLPRVSFEALLKFVRRIVCPQSSFERRVSEKKVHRFGPNRFRGFFKASILADLKSIHI